MNRMNGPLLKLERANQHIDELGRIFRAHVDDFIAPAMAQPAADVRARSFGSLSTQLPRHTPTVIGDALHNLRAALDHAYWVAVTANGGEFSKFCKFPFGQTRASVEGMLNGWHQRNKPIPAVVNFIVADLQPYEGGRLHLYDLDRLDITDKHHVLLPSLFAFRFEANTQLQAGSGPALRGEDGTTFVWSGQPGGNMIASLDGPLTYTGNLHNAVQIWFGSGPLEREPVLPKLRELRDNTEAAIRGIDALLPPAATSLQNQPS